MINTLNKVVATVTVFGQNQRGYHWNIQGKDFYDLHKVTEELYEYAVEATDMVAERIRQLGELPIHSLESCLEQSSIKSNTDVTDANEIMKATHAELLAIDAVLKAGIEKADEVDDDGTEDMLIEILREIQKQAWMVKSWLS